MNDPSSSGKSDQSDKSDDFRPPPACPLCTKPMWLRTARKGPHADSRFWGCSGYPEYKGTRPADPTLPNKP